VRFGFWPFRERKAAHGNSLDAVLERLDGQSGGGVTAAEAISVAAVFAAQRVIAEDVAKLPARLRRKTPDGDVTAADRPEHLLLSRAGRMPDGDQDRITAQEWIEVVIGDAALHGAGVAWLNRLRDRVLEIVPLRRSQWMREYESGVGWRWRIRTSDTDDFRPVDRSELLVLRGPMMGASPLGAVGAAVRVARGLDRMLSTLAERAGRPSGLLVTEAFSSQDAARTFIERIAKRFGPGGEGGLVPVDVGKAELVRLSLTPEEIEIDDARKRVIEDVARVFRVQPARLMHEMGGQTYASAYQWNIAHVTDTIQPWARRLCGAFDMDVLGPRLIQQGYYSDVELKGLLRGSPGERAEFMMKLRTMGALSPRQVAALEDLPTDGLSDDPMSPLLTNPPAGRSASEGQTGDDDGDS
jgi:HK97 family phage portal protein